MTRALNESERTAVLAELAEPLSLKSDRGPAPLYRPTPDWQGDVLPADDPGWQRLDALRDEAWRLGISAEDLRHMEVGYCTYQIKTLQTERLQEWIAARQAS